MLALKRGAIPTKLIFPCTDVRMIVGPGRIKVLRFGSPGPRSSNQGLVVQAVLVMALVSTIGVLIIAARVAGSRQSSASSSLSQTARQAAEYGYAEIVAEMNRDPKSYLWVLNSSNWSTVSAEDLKTCGVAASADPSADPIPALNSSQALSRSPELSYKLEKYEAPRWLKKPSSDPNDCGDKFGNLLGGSGILTIVGTVNRGSGYTSTYTMKRNVSVNRAAPIFNNPITAPPSPSIRTPDAADSRFPPFRDPPDGTPYAISCEPEGAPDVIKCTADPGSLTATFKSGNATTTEEVYDSTGLKVDYFPYIYTSGLPWSNPGPCQQAEGSVRCLVKTMEVKANTNMLVATTRGTPEAPVEIFLSENMTIEPLAKLSGENSGDNKGWSKFRIFGVTSGASCDSQTITINSYNNSAPTPATVEPNLQNAFLWLSKGKLKYESLTALTSIPALVGSVCEGSVITPAYLSTLSNRGFFEGLGGAYGFRGVFGGTTPIRFFFRGYGFNEQRLSS